MAVLDHANPDSRPCSRGHDVDVNVGKATHPAIEPAIDLAHRCVSKPALLHRLVHDGVVVRFVVEHHRDDAAVRDGKGVVLRMTATGHCARSANVVAVTPSGAPWRKALPTQMIAADRDSSSNTDGALPNLTTSSNGTDAD